MCFRDTIIIMAICLDVQLSCCGLVTLVTYNLIYDYQTNLNNFV